MLDPHRFRIGRSVRRFLRGIKRERVLDVGSGESPYAKEVAATRLVRADLSRRGNMDVRADAHRLPFRSDSFDVVLATELIEHVLEPKKVIAEMARVTRRGGTVIVTWPLLWGQHEDVDYHRFTPMAMDALAAEAGLSRAELDSRGGIFTAIVALLGRVPFEAAGGHPLGGLTKGIGVAWRVLLLPLALLAIILDLLDRRRAFTLGFQGRWTKS